jgi:hypothetical protein
MSTTPDELLADATNQHSSHPQEVECEECSITVTITFCGDEPLFEQDMYCGCGERRVIA